MKSGKLNSNLLGHILRFLCSATFTGYLTSHKLAAWLPGSSSCCRCGSARLAPCSIVACRYLPLPTDINKKAALHFDFNYAQSFFKFNGSTFTYPPCFPQALAAAAAHPDAVAVAAAVTSLLRVGVGGTRQKLIIEQASDAIC